jgi:hypothetical protein
MRGIFTTNNKRSFDFLIYCLYHLCEFVVSFPLQDNIPRHPSPPVVVWQLKHCPVASHIIRHCPLTPVCGNYKHCLFASHITRHPSLPVFVWQLKHYPVASHIIRHCPLTPFCGNYKHCLFASHITRHYPSSPLFVTIKPCVHWPISMSPLAYMINCLQSCLRYEWEPLWSRSYDNWI